jgi:hypothetical protein
MFLPLHLRVQNTPNSFRLTNITDCSGSLIDIFTTSTLNIALANLAEKSATLRILHTSFVDTMPPFVLNS